MKNIAAAVIVASFAASAQAQPSLTPLPETPCEAVNGLSFICGLKQAEDAIQIPGTRWMLISSMAPGGGINVVDTATKKAYALYTASTPKKRDRTYPGCATAPDPAKFSTHGLNLRAISSGRYVLNTVTHSPTESIHVFALDARGDAPAIVWKGCIAIADNHAANSIASFADGSMVTTIFAGIKRADGKTDGAVYAWKPGDKQFEELKGTELPAPNGIEIARDQNAFYVVSSSDQSFHVFARDGRELRSGKTPDFYPDNLRWNGDRLISAGMTRDEPACGGEFVWQDLRKRACKRGYMVASVDPDSLKWTTVAYAEPNPVFGGVSMGTIVGDTLWLSTWTDNRIGYRPVPRFP
jgi:hypothetical protein